MSDIVKAVIIEDEYPAARLLNKMISVLRPEWDVEILPGSVSESVEWFASHPHPDIIFLDIQLTDGNSFMFLKQAEPESMIVFTTAYDDYAVRAFRVNSIDYLLKPVSRDRLLEAIEKFERFSSSSIADYNRQLDIKGVLMEMYGNGARKRYRTRFLITMNGHSIALPVSEVAYFYSEDKVTYAVSKDSRRFMIDYTLNRLEDELDPDMFFRISRQFMLSVSSIRRMEPYDGNRVRVYLDPEYEGVVQVSRERVSSLKQWLDY